MQTRLGYLGAALSSLSVAGHWGHQERLDSFLPLTSSLSLLSISLECQHLTTSKHHHSACEFEGRGLGENTFYEDKTLYSWSKRNFMLSVSFLQGNPFGSLLTSFIAVRSGLGKPKNETTAPVSNCSSHFRDPELPPRHNCECEKQVGCRDRGLTLWKLGGNQKWQKAAQVVHLPPVAPAKWPGRARLWRGSVWSALVHPGMRKWIK